MSKTRVDLAADSPASRIAAIGLVRTIGIVEQLGVATGFLAGIVAAFALEAAPVAMFAGFAGAVVGLFLAPLLAFTLLRRVPFGIGIVWTVLALIGGPMAGTLSGSAIVGLTVAIAGPASLCLLERCGARLPDTKAVVVAIALLIIDSRFLTAANDRNAVSSMLGIPSLPPGVKVLGCEDPGFSTDVVENCALTMSPGDLETLLAGHPYVKGAGGGSTKGMGYHQSGGGVVSLGDGPFQSATVYTYAPAKYRGGQLRVLVDATRTRAVLDLYIE